jgi:hypothetical protein
LTTKRTRTTRPLGSNPITGLSSLLQGGPPRCPASVLSPSQIQLFGVLPYADRRQHNGRSHRGERFPRFAPAPEPSSRHLCAGQPPGQECRHPPDSSQGNNWTLVPIVVATLTTLPQWFTRVRLLGSHLTPSRAPFPQRSPPRLIHRSSLRWFATIPCVDRRGGPNLHHRCNTASRQHPSTSEPPSAFVAHNHRRNGR